jgi:hypothetical protein
MIDPKDLGRAQSEYAHWQRLDEAQLALERQAKDTKVVMFRLADPTGRYPGKDYLIMVPIEDAVRLLLQQMERSRKLLAAMGVRSPYPSEPPEDAAAEIRDASTGPGPAADDPRWIPAEPPL